MRPNPIAFALTLHQQKMEETRQNRERRHRPYLNHAQRCTFCLKPLPGAAYLVCSDECDDGWWQIVPTLSGSLYRPHQQVK
jgi:hypothetical protein